MAGESQETPGTAPDPTVRTTEQLIRVTRSERDYVDGQFDVIRARLDGMDQATKVLHETVTRTPTEIQLAVGHLKELHDEKFASVAQQFLGRDEAVKAAFAAQEKQAQAQDAGNQKAIDKSEKTTMDTISQKSSLIDDLKTRVERIENLKQGGQETLAAIYALAGFVVSLVVLGGLLAATGAFSR